eukprot:3249282-Pyramimonas_sp.AAC.1
MAAGGFLEGLDDDPALRSRARLGTDIAHKCPGPDPHGGERVQEPQPDGIRRRCCHAPIPVHVAVAEELRPLLDFVD